MSLNIWEINLRAFSKILVGAELLLCSVFLFSIPTLVVAQVVQGGCQLPTPSSQDFGPYDYRPERYIPESTYGSHKKLLRIVESTHFTPGVEALIRGNTSSVGGDLTYTLAVFPNHHRALMAMVALGVKEKTDKPQGSRYSVECWFSRAIAWRPDDNIVRMIYANYLAKAKRVNEAEQQLSIAASQAGDNAFTHNNIGLLYFDMKNYEKALIHAHKAYELGLGVPTLRDQLKSIGKWSESTQNPPVEAIKNSQ
jgi:hypothetical protein